jgi:CMP-N,N'-diacetyllegionaminic acid synthase
MAKIIYLQSRQHKNSISGSMMKTIAIIPARGGSKGIPRKNMVKINGFPLIHYTIHLAVSSGLFEKIIVTSDDQEILDYASQFDVLIHKRDAELASDTAPVFDTIREVMLLAQDRHCIVYDAVMLLQPTSPLRIIQHLEEAINLLERNNHANSVISVAQMGDTHPARMYEVSNSFLKPLQSEHEKSRRQDLPQVYIRNGSIYLARKEMVLRNNDIMVKPTVPLIMSNEFYLNIDEPRDLYLARYMMEGAKG